MNYLYIALVLTCLFASAFADCIGNSTIDEWNDSNEFSSGCLVVPFTVDTSAALSNQTIIAAVHIPDDEDMVGLTISYDNGNNGTITSNTTSSKDNEARICIGGDQKSDAMVITVSTNQTLTGTNTTAFSFYFEIADDCENVSSPSGGFCCWGWVILGLVVVVLIVVIIAAVAGFMIWKKRQSQDKYIYDDA